ncbi:hypothetical protein OROHE_026919 [Orobanche hederae]
MMSQPRASIFPSCTLCEPVKTYARKTAHLREFSSGGQDLYLRLDAVELGKLVDLREFSSGGQDLYLRLDAVELVLANRPDEIALETFKLLLEYWNDESVQERAKENAVSRTSYVDTHTLGPKSFAQHRYKMKKKDVAKELEPCDAEVFIETRKRVEGRMYKTNPEIITKKIDNITKKLTTGDTASDELGAKHGPNWLKGRCFKSGMSSSNPPTETYVKELTTRIKGSLASELEEKMKKAESEFQARVKRVVEAEFEQKMQRNLAFALKKLGEANPNITVDIEELCAIAISDVDTPITGGSSF